MPKLSITVVISTMPPVMPKVSPQCVSTKNQNETSSSAKPTTFNPMTAPDRNATFRPSLSEFFTACAVRAEAFVAMRMPNQPHKPERNPASGTPSIDSAGCNSRSLSNPRNTTRPMKTSVTIRYCRFR